MRRFLVDTTTISQLAKRQPNAGAVEKLGQHHGEIAISVVTLCDLVYMSLYASKKEHRDAFANVVDSDYVAELEVLDYDREAALEHARMRGERKLTPPWTDGQLAATAARRGLIVVTNNVKHFSGYAGLTVIDWHS